MTMLSERTVPENPEQWADMLRDTKRMDHYIASQEGRLEFATLLVDYGNKAVHSNNGELGKDIANAMEKGWERFAESNGYKAEGQRQRLPLDPSALSAQDRTIERMGRRAPGAGLNGEYEGFGEFLSAAWNGPGSGTSVSDKIVAATKNLNESAGADGGFLVPEEFRAEILRSSLEQAIVRSRARVVPMSGLQLRYPAIRDVSHATNVYGGVSASWKAERATVSSTTNQPTFSNVMLTAKKLTAYTVAGNELMEDAAFALESLLMDLFGDALAYFEDDAFIQGIGVGQPVGIENADALITITKETGQAATTIVYENILKMFARMLPQSHANAVWLANINTFPQLATMSLSVGTGGAPVFLGNAVGGPPNSILGRPLIFTEKLPTLGTASDLMFVDLSKYLIGDRQAMTVFSSPHVNFTTDETVWRIISRLDGRPWIDSALTPRNGDTLSPFVNIATRS